MGTSNIRSSPARSELSLAKGYITSYIKDTPKRHVTPKKIINQYIAALEGPAKILSSTPQSGGNNAIYKSMKTSQAIIGFLSNVNAIGFDRALKEEGLGHLIGKSISEIFSGLVEKFSGNGANLSESIVNDCLWDALNELSEKEANNYEELKDNLDKAFSEEYLKIFLKKFISSIILRQFYSDLALQLERTAKSVEDLSNKFGYIKDYVFETVSFELDMVKNFSVNWRAQEGMKLIRKILKEILEDFLSD